MAILLPGLRLGEVGCPVELEHRDALRSVDQFGDLGRILEQVWGLPVGLIVRLRLVGLNDRHFRKVRGAGGGHVIGALVRHTYLRWRHESASQGALFQLQLLECYLYVGGVEL